MSLTPLLTVCTVYSDFFSARSASEGESQRGRTLSRRASGDTLCEVRRGTAAQTPDRR